MKLYFAYGANLNIDSMSYRCPDAVAVQPFYLQGWSLAFSGVATIRPDADGCVAGALWAISDADERSLDIFEGYPTIYRKEVIRSDGLELMFYVMNSDGPGVPSANYLMTIAQGYQDWNLDIDYLTLAVHRTEQEINDYDMQWSTHTGSLPGDAAADLADHVHLEPGYDICRLRDVESSHRDPDSIQ